MLMLQVLKLIRYTSKLVLASALADSKSDVAVRLKAFESSIGTSRCVYCHFLLFSLAQLSFQGVYTHSDILSYMTTMLRMQESLSVG